MGGANFLGEFLKAYSTKTREKAQDKISRADSLMSIAIKQAEIADSVPYTLEDGTPNPVRIQANKYANDYIKQANKILSEKHGHAYEFIGKLFGKKSGDSKQDQDTLNAIDSMAREGGKNFVGPPQSQANAPEKPGVGPLLVPPEKPSVQEAGFAGMTPSQGGPGLPPTLGTRTPPLEVPNQPPQAPADRAQPGASVYSGMEQLKQPPPGFSWKAWQSAILPFLAKEASKAIAEPDAREFLVLNRALAAKIGELRSQNPNLNASHVYGDKEFRDIFDRMNQVNINSMAKYGKPVIPNVNEQMEQLVPGWKLVNEFHAKEAGISALNDSPEFQRMHPDPDDRARIFDSIRIGGDGGFISSIVPDDRPGHEGDWVNNLYDKRTLKLMGSIPANTPADQREREDKIRGIMSQKNVDYGTARGIYQRMQIDTENAKLAQLRVSMEAAKQLADLRKSYQESRPGREKAERAGDVYRLALSHARAKSEDNGLSVDENLRTVLGAAGIDQIQLLRDMAGTKESPPEEEAERLRKSKESPGAKPPAGTQYKP